MMLKGNTTFDPSQDPRAIKEWAHLKRKVAVKDLFFCHDEVLRTFQHGKHKGQPVENLLKACRKECGPPKKMPPLVAMKKVGKLWVIYGNRRLKALQMYQNELKEKGSKTIVRVEVFVHKWNPKDCLVAKFMDATTTRNGGTNADFVRLGA